MNIVNYIRFGQDPRNGAQQQSHSPKMVSPEESEETASEMAGARRGQPIPVPEYTTRDWLVRLRNCRIERRQLLRLATSSMNR